MISIDALPAELPVGDPPVGGSPRDAVTYRGPGYECSPAREEGLRHRLRQDPNDALAFAELSVVHSRRLRGLSAGAVESSRLGGVSVGSPGAGSGREGRVTTGRSRSVDDAAWSLAEELASDARFWRPLVQLARLSLQEDRPGAVPRVRAAFRRDGSGRALADSIGVLRLGGCPHDALGLGLARWRPGVHVPEAGRELVRAAAEAGRVAELRGYLRALPGRANRPARDEERVLWDSGRQ